MNRSTPSHGSPARTLLAFPAGAAGRARRARPGLVAILAAAVALLVGVPRRADAFAARPWAVPARSPEAVAAGDKAAPPGPVGRPAGPTFAAFFERQLTAPQPLPAEVLEAARRYRYVFVAGFLNEGFKPGYFNENREALAEAGVVAGAIHVVFPHSADAVEETAARLGHEIPDLAAQGPEKLVLVGHSKGGAELLAFALGNPTFVRERVAAIFLVQAAIGGSGVADYVTDKGHPLDDRMPAASRVAFSVAARGGKLLDGHLDRGFQSLTHDRAAALWARLLPSGHPNGRHANESKATAAAPPFLAERIFYVRSHRAPERVSKMLSLTATYLTTYYGDNDGLVQVEDQWLPGTGRVLATLDVDHMALTVARPVSGDGPAFRRAFTQALLMQLAGVLASAPAPVPAAGARP